MKDIETELEFNELIKENKFVLVDFYTTWCGACPSVSAALSRISKDFTVILFVNVNCDEFEKLADKYDIMGVPTLILFKNGKKFKEIESQTVKGIKKELNEYVPKAP